MEEHKNSYRQIFKATSIFGGVQFIGIIIAIIRSKFVAILLGPTGMGIAGLFSTALGLISGLTNFGIATSAVRDIAAANADEDKRKIVRTATVFRKLVWFTGILGTLVCFVLAPWISQLTFGTKDYTVHFYWLSVTLLLGQLVGGQNVILQGMRRLSALAKAGTIGSVLSLLVSIPLYYFYKIDGIVPAILASALCTLLVALFYGKTIKLSKIAVPWKSTFIEGKEMLKMGFLLSVTGFVTLGESYIIRIFISNTGSLADVGFYNAGFNIIGTYVGMVFTAMATDYFPRLSAVSDDNVKLKALINQQAEIALLILGPILSIFIVFIKLGIIILYSKQFLVMDTMMYWAVIAMFFKATSWAMAFIFLAKMDSRVYFWNEMFGVLYLLVFNILGYHFGGLTGLGVSFLFAYFAYSIQVFIIIYNKYQFRFNREFLKIFIIQLSLVFACFGVVYFLGGLWGYAIGTVLIIICLFFSVNELNKKVQFLPLLKEKFMKK